MHAPWLKLRPPPADAEQIVDARARREDPSTPAEMALVSASILRTAGADRAASALRTWAHATGRARAVALASFEEAARSDERRRMAIAMARPGAAPSDGENAYRVGARRAHNMQALVRAVAELGVPMPQALAEALPAAALLAPPPPRTIADAKRILAGWLEAIGAKRDVHGNWHLPSAPGRRWHWTTQRLQWQERVDGAWRNLRSDNPVELANAMREVAAQATDDDASAAAAGRGSAMRDATKRRAAIRTAARSRHAESLAVAWREAEARWPAWVRLSAFGGRLSADQVAELREFVSSTAARLDGGHVDVPPGPEPTVDAPPALPFLWEELNAKWTHRQAGMPYTVRIEHTPAASARQVTVHLGSAPLGAQITASGRYTMRASARDDDGDGYLQGEILAREGQAVASVLMLVARPRAMAAGLRLLAIWCRLMRGYGVERWIGRGMNDDARRLFRALERRGSLVVLEENSGGMMVSCGPDRGAHAELQSRQNPPQKPAWTTTEAMVARVGREWGDRHGTSWALRMVPRRQITWIDFRNPRNEDTDAKGGMAHVRSLASVIRRGDPLPPAVGYEDGGTIVAHDGNHRITASVVARSGSLVPMVVYVPSFRVNPKEVPGRSARKISSLRIEADDVIVQEAPAV